MPRETLLTPAVQDVIVKFVNAGATIPVAGEAAGIKWRTVKLWLSRGRQGEEPYATFVDKVEQAKAVHRAALELVVTAAAKRGDWRAAAYRLDRRSAAQRARDAQEAVPPPAQPLPPDPDERVVLLYPVPVPLGAHISQLALAPGHAIDTEASEVPEEDDHGEHGPV